MRSDCHSHRRRIDALTRPTRLAGHACSGDPAEHENTPACHKRDPPSAATRLCQLFNRIAVYQNMFIESMCTTGKACDARVNWWPAKFRVGCQRQPGPLFRNVLMGLFLAYFDLPPPSRKRAHLWSSLSACSMHQGQYSLTIQQMDSEAVS